MKLSEAIRKGAEMVPKGTGAYVSMRFNQSGQMIRSACALGAAYLGVVGLPNKPQDWLFLCADQMAVYNQLQEQFPILREPVKPAKDGFKLLDYDTHWDKLRLSMLSDLGKWIADRNDDGRTREWIADRLEERGL